MGGEWSLVRGEVGEEEEENELGKGYLWGGKRARGRGK